MVIGVYRHLYRYINYTVTTRQNEEKNHDSYNELTNETHAKRLDVYKLNT